MPWTLVGNIITALLPKVISMMEKQKPEQGAGEEKRSAVKEIVMAAATAVEGGLNLDLFNDPELSKLYDQMNNSIVSYQNALAKKAAAEKAGTSTAPTTTQPRK